MHRKFQHRAWITKENSQWRIFVPSRISDSRLRFRWFRNCWFRLHSSFSSIVYLFNPNRIHIKLVFRKVLNNIILTYKVGFYFTVIASLLIMYFILLLFIWYFVLYLLNFILDFLFNLSKCKFFMLLNELSPFSALSLLSSNESFEWILSSFKKFLILITSCSHEKAADK